MRVSTVNSTKPGLALIFCFLVFGVFDAEHVWAKNGKPDSVLRSRQALEYGTVFYDFYQQDYFTALVDHEYVSHLGNPIALGDQSQVLKGGMLVSYGVPNQALPIFERLLASTHDEETQNSAWYYLARLYYNKSDAANAAKALSNIKGRVSPDVHAEYHYLATLININGNHLEKAEQAFEVLPQTSPYHPYLRFNMAIGHLKSGNLVQAVGELEHVASYAGQKEELLVLADRARHGLAQLAIQSGNFLAAWNYLTGIRSVGLYSNRALLTYAWAAIKLKRFEDAISALEILNERSIALPEVQEAKVLLAHLYEQQGEPRKALKSNLLAEKEFKKGLEQVEEARRIIGLRDVPREFIRNLEAIMDESEWHGVQLSVDYKKLTPFLIDLMASNAFTEVLRELTDLYYIQNNLQYWSKQTAEHALILENSSQKTFDKNVRQFLQKSETLQSRFDDQTLELRLLTLTLEESVQDRMSALIETTMQELKILQGTVNQLKDVKAPYRLPESYDGMVAALHKRLDVQLAETNKFISVLEPVMRDLVNVELNKHEERMRYYWAQSRLAKARLYDSTLLELEQAKSMTNDSEKGE
ncbi:hypothetical protein [Teredinibacter sp. KSP-S5-2]|uniref:tetratricopeptide repeat protein n=1 Tax=Teredinibacter sp. KSP-S5-2 TaxID=3034506 RepID=UPI0029351D20|nr:hypothetical protein [Teredinibacter sp. KSP-S5-2]WNO10721.1 hypothetical protein P5V12_05985 [Teredinibacter sp. KSP-S5-2]